MKPFLLTALSAVLLLSSSSSTAAETAPARGRIAKHVLPLTLGVSATGTLGTPAEVDRFTFTGSPGQRLYLDNLRIDLSAVGMRLESPSGNPVFNLVGQSADQGPFYLTEAGRHTLVVESLGDGSGEYSFQLTDLAGATALTLGTPVSGQLDPRSSTRAYRFAGTAGQVVNLESLEPAATEATWRLVGTHNQYLLAGTLSSSLGEAFLPNTGTYLVLIEGVVMGAAPLPFQFRVSTVSLPSGTPAGFGIVRSGTVNPGDPPVVFNYTAPAGLVAYYDDQLFNSAPLTFELKHSDGTVVASGATPQNAGPYRLTKSGNYTLTVQGQDATSGGDYRFNLLDLGTNSQPLTLGSPISTPAMPGYRTDVWRFTGEPGQRLFLDSLILGALQVYAQLITPSGNWLFAYSWSGSTDLGPLTLTEPGTYYLLFENSQADPADVGFRMVDLNQAPAADLAFNTVVSGTLDPASAAALLRFSGSAGQRLFIDGRNPVDPVSLYLYGPANQYLGGVGLTSYSEFVLPQTGLYLAHVTSANPNPTPYAFQATIAPSTTQALAFGTETTGSLTAAGEEHRFEFTGAAGQRLLYDALDTDADNINVRLLDPGGAIFALSQNSDSDSAPFTLTVAGTYTLIVGGNTPTLGDYRFRLIEVASPPAAALPLNAPVSGILDPFSTMAVLRFSGASGQRMLFDSNDPAANGWWILYGPANQALASAWLGSDFEVTLPSAGTYLLVLIGAGPGPTTYSFHARTPTTTSTPLTLANTHTGTIATPGEEHRYSFAGAVGQRLLYDALGAPGDSPFLRLITPSGAIPIQQMANQDFSPYTLTENGSYTLVLGGVSDPVGPYSFRLLDQATATPLSLGTIATGRLDPGNRLDLYRFTGTAAQRLRLESLSASGSEANWRLFGPANQQLTSTGIQTSPGELSLPGAGTCLLVVEGWADATAPLDYQIRVTDISDAPVAPDTFSAIQTAVLAPGETRTLTFQAPAGLPVFFDSLQPNAWAINVGLTAEDSTVVFVISAASNGGPFFLPKSGTYTLTTTADPGGPGGEFRFRLLNLDLAATLLVAGTAYTASFDEPYQTAAYRIAATAGQRYYYDALGMTTISSASVAFYEPAGLNWSWSAGASFDWGPYTLTYSGSSYLMLENGDPNTAGTAQFRWLDIDQAPTTPLVLDTLVTGTLPARETLLHRLQPSAALRAFLDSFSPEANVASWIAFDPANTPLTSGNLGTDAEFVLTRAGTHVFALQNTTDNPVPYSFRAIMTSTSTSALTLGTVHSGALAQPGDQRHFTFLGTAGQRLYYDALQTDFAPVTVMLFSPQANIVALFGNNSDADVGPFTLPVTGSYTLVQHNNSDQPADFSFRLLDLATAPELVLDTPTGTTLTPGTQAVLYRLTPLPGMNYFFQPLPGEAPPVWGLYNHQDSLLASSSGGYFEWTPNAATPHALVIGGGGLDSLSYRIQVLPANHPPRVPQPADPAFNEESPFAFTVAATDPEQPNDQLTFALSPGAPPGLTLAPTTGQLQWTPTEAQGPGSYPVTVTVSDDGVPSLSTSVTFNLNVQEVNRPPTLSVPADQSLDEMTALAVTATATDPDLPANTLTFSLVSPPAGMTINPTTGAIAWTPTEAQGPGTYPVSVRVTDNGTPALNDTKAFTVIVREVNAPPQLTVPAEQALDELTALAVTATATDPDLPANTLAFSLVSPPAGMNINPTTGAIAWTPTEAQGPGTYPVSVRVTDNGTPALDDTKVFTVVVREVNRAPTLEAIANRTLHAGGLVEFTPVASDPDLPANTLTYSLSPAGVAGVAFNTATGLFRWAPTGDQLGNQSFTISVTDNGLPPLNASRTFTLSVRDRPRLAVTLSGDQIAIAWDSIPGLTYQIQFKTTLNDAAWLNLGNPVSAVGDAASQIDTVTGSSRFYRIQLSP
ncbi:MAG: hypothetical protein FJ387_01625 [Verrucomicrobia bacterium]|nr:hypothetical protein [Verrucomicrobiota bacterium]